MTGPRRPLRGITPQASPAVLEARYERVAGRTPPGDDVDAMEAALGVDLPDDARAIIRFYRGGMLGGISHLTWATTGSYSVVERTAALRRALDLPAIFVVLAEPVEAAIVWRRDRRSRSAGTRRRAAPANTWP